MGNHAFEQMKKVALGWLEGKDPRQIARNTGIDFDGQCLAFSSLGRRLTVTWPDYSIHPAVGAWHHLLILHYLNLGDGAALTGREMAFGQMRDGLVRGGGIDRRCEQAIKGLNVEKLEAICRSLGAEKITTNADVAYRIPFLPRFPVILKVWLPDEDFPASGRLLVDESADHYFTIEDAVTVAELILAEF